MKATRVIIYLIHMVPMLLHLKAPLVSNRSHCAPKVEHAFACASADTHMNGPIVSKQFPLLQLEHTFMFPKTIAIQQEQPYNPLIYI